MVTCKASGSCLRFHACGGVLPSANAHFSAQMAMQSSLHEFRRVRQGPPSVNLAEESYKFQCFSLVVLQKSRKIPGGSQNNPGHSSIFSHVVHKNLEIRAFFARQKLVHKNPANFTLGVHKNHGNFQHVKFCGLQAF